MWNSGGGPAADSNGSIYLLTSNGTFNAVGGSYGQSFVKLSLGASGFTVDDYFTPGNFTTLNINDWDMSSGAIALLPDQTGEPHPQLLVGGGKDGVLYLLNRPANRPSHENAAEYLDKAFDLCERAGFKSILMSRAGSKPCPRL